MTPEKLLIILRRYWMILAIGMVVGGFLGFAAGAVQPKTYTANSSGFLTTSSSATGQSNSVALASAADTYAKSRAQSYADLGKSRVVADNVIEKLQLNTSAQTLVGAVQVSVPIDTVTIQVSARASDPQLASDIANAWISAMAEEVKNLEAPGDATGSMATIELTPMESAVVPTSPTAPNLKLYVSLGALAGLILSLAFVMLKNQYDKRIRSTADIEAVTEHAIVGKLPMEKILTASESRLSPDMEATADVRVRSSAQLLNESLRELRTNLEFLDVDNPPKSIVVTSALPGDGKSTVAANLATMIASSGQHVILIDADLRKPTVAKSFNIPGEIGLSDVLAGRTTLGDAVHRWSPNHEMYILPSGSIPPNPAELLRSNTMKDLIDSLTEENIVVIIDAPPVLPVTDASILAAKFDGALVVASANITRTDSLEDALSKIENVSGRILGIVLNRVPVKGLEGTNYGYYGKNNYYYQQSENSSEKRASTRKRVS